LTTRTIICAFLFAIFLALAPLAWTAEPPADIKQNTWTGVDRIVAIGDVHGDYGQFVKALQTGELVDDQLHWKAGKTHFVQTGDVFDRGPDSKKVMDLLMTLQQQAADAGGMVHTLLGNHEVMVMSGDLRYTHPGEFEAFGGKAEYVKAISKEGKYGQWLRTHNCVIKINDNLFMHGGLSKAWMHLSLDKINQGVREFLLTGGGDRNLVRSGGPLWYRGWATTRGEERAALCDPVFQEFDVRHAIVGHTPQRGISAFGGGRVICIDTGMSAAYGGPPSCVIIEGDHYYSARYGEQPLPLEVDYESADLTEQPVAN
jgi:hypothetical protein